MQHLPDHVTLVNYSMARHKNSVEDVFLNYTCVTMTMQTSNLGSRSLYFNIVVSYIYVLYMCNHDDANIESRFKVTGF